VLKGDAALPRGYRRLLAQALHCIAVCCSVLQCVGMCCSVVCCSMLQYVAVCCRFADDAINSWLRRCSILSVLQCAAVSCSVACCSVVFCSVLQCVAISPMIFGSGVAVYSSVLQCAEYE